MSGTERVPYEYAVLRVVPRPDLAERLNAGVVLFCPELKFLGARVHLDESLLRTFSPELPFEVVEDHLRSAESVCVGGIGPLGGLPQRQRFGRIVAPRSGIVQPSEVHTGLTRDPERTLERLLVLLTRSGCDLD